MKFGQVVVRTQASAHFCATWGMNVALHIMRRYCAAKSAKAQILGNI